MISSKKLNKQKDISHGFFNRSGGKSSGIFKSLNCGPGSKDRQSKVRANLKIVKNKICKKSKKIFLMHQVHGNNVVFIDKNFVLKKKIRADAVITNKRMFPIAVLTADCVPILIYDKQKKIIAAVHAGWKGALKEIVKKVIKFMIKKGCKEKNIIATIGPCIQQKNYNVGEDFFKKFLKKNKMNRVFFKKEKKTIYFNLPDFVKYQLKSMKITNIDTIKIDTFDTTNNFFSARRSIKLNHDDYGRNISIIMIN